MSLLVLRSRGSRSREDGAAAPASVAHVDEIDGLRAVAILAVLLYHLNSNWVSGGFVGVDVFFVISGYLITRILLSGLEQDRLSLGDFYKRRILRIAPALFVTLAATALVFFVLLPPAWSGDLFASLASAVLSYSNLWFYATIDYFANNASNPVLHAWSLAVEEQFYLVLPLLLLLIRKSGAAGARVSILAGLALASLVASGALAPASQAKAFYFPWLRAWELLAGSLLATVRLDSISAGAKAFLSYGGTALILAGCFLYTDSTVFPGYSALVPCLGSVAIIAGAGGSSVPNRLLRVPFVRWIGQISYSLYLVHWPLVCMASLLVSLHPFKVRIAVLLASFALAWLSWRYVEVPFRAAASRVSTHRVMCLFAAAVAALFAWFALMQSAGSWLWTRFPEALRYSDYLRTDTSLFRSGTCFLSQRHGRIESFSFDACLTPDAGRRNALVIGDSHGANIVQALAERHPGVHVLQATSAGCKPTIETDAAPHCDLIDVVYRDWLPRAGAGVEFVVLAARWDQADIEPLKRTVSYLHKLGKRVILFGPSPEYFVSVPLILAYEQIAPIELKSRLLKRERFELDLRMRAEFSGKASYFSPMDNLCHAGECRIVENGVPVLFDRDHFTLPGAGLILRGFPLP